MTGEMYINTTDIYTVYGVTPLRGTFSALLKPVAAKAPISVDIDTMNGEDVYFAPTPPVAARSFTIPFAIVATNATNFLAKKEAFEVFLRNGMLAITSPKIPGKTFRCYLEEFDQYSQLEPITTRRVSAIIHVKLREPNPANR
jgi:hypothetical protein